MGKRELFIICAFVVAGVAAYQLSAPPAAEGQGFSLTRFLQGIRREVNPASASYEQRGRIPLGRGIKELRFSGAVRQLRITGEDREDLEYELVVNSSGPDEATATSYAKRTMLQPDEIDETLTLEINYPEEATQTAGLSLRVPHEIAVRISGRGTPVVTNVHAVYLESLLGDATLEGINGEVHGSHRSGRLTVKGAERVDLTLNSSRATLVDISRGLTLNVQGGECSVSESRGPVTIEGRNAEMRVADHDGDIRVTGTGGNLRIDAPGGWVKADVQRMEVEVTVDTAVPMTLFTTDEPLRLLLPDEAKLAVDAATSGGEIQSSEFDLTPDVRGRDARLSHNFGASQPKIALRNSRGDIVIRRRK
ncbi:MAG TPA: DUF4097 family beta strand repeat-containing protein [Vicinamibacterales bacterium]|nr:DUF4097 family beta strand repeat-containing protein [Vicinamibacterales bacterium]